VTVRVRLAPSPTGTLHIGTAPNRFSTAVSPAITAVRSCCGSRTPTKERSKPEFTANILDGLSWLGLGWDGEPVIQSEQIEATAPPLPSLLASGHAYRCFMSEAELEQDAPGAEGTSTQSATPQQCPTRDLSAAQQAAFAPKAARR